MKQHQCVGPTCWTCGEPSELRDMKSSMMEAFSKEKVANDVVWLSRIATQAIREDVIFMMTKIVELETRVYQLQQQAANPGVCNSCGASLRECEACGW